MVYEKATIYMGDLWGYDRVEASNVTWRFESYAQYENVGRVEYTPRGKRKRKTAMATATPVIILEGWGHPDPPRKWGPIEQFDEFTTTQTTRRLACDPEWEHEFQAFLDGYLAGSGTRVLQDFRGLARDRYLSKPVAAVL